MATPIITDGSLDRVRKTPRVVLPVRSDIEARERDTEGRRRRRGDGGGGIAGVRHDDGLADDIASFIHRAIGSAAIHIRDGLVNRQGGGL